MRTKSLGFIAIVSLMGSVQAQTPSSHSKQIAADFGALESISQISLAPDGGKIAYVGRIGENQVIFIADLSVGGNAKPIARIAPEDGKLSWCRWASGSRLVCQIRLLSAGSGRLLGFSRLFALDADGSNMVKLTRETNFNSRGIMQDGGYVIDWDVAGKPGQILMTRQYIPDDHIGSNIGNRETGLGVDLVDTVSLKHGRYEGPNKLAVDYLTDGHGNVRIMGTQESNGLGYSANKVQYYYRSTESKRWRTLSTVGLTDAGSGGFSPVAVDSALDVVYGFDDEKDTTALFSIALDGSNKRQLVLARSDVDIDQLVTIGRDNRVVGASYATERRTTEYFDQELKSLSTALSKALPGRPNVDIIDASEDESKLLLLAWSDTNPGMFYLFDKTTKHLDELLPVRNELTKTSLAPVKAVSFLAADGTAIPAYLTLPAGSTGKGLPTIVMPHGGPGARDEWGFDWLAQYFAARGYAVLQPNFRGSSGYGNAWYQDNGFKSWRVAVGDVNDAGRWLISSGIAAPDKLAILGWSYGGYAALQSSTLDPDLFKAVVAIAPVTDLERLRQESQDYTNFRQVDAFIGQGPHIREGSPAQNVERFKAPVLLFHGDLDQNVGVGESRLMDSRLRGAGKQVTYVEFKGLGHQLESSAARTKVLYDSDAFLRKAFGMPAD